ncbi:LysR substrate-binding domain-containing protein [Pelagerythrobacter marensis]|jgi:LysR family glycine cleavage system transcriptional activator|nr:LysR substrate-binding domain-containing protein [Pelagerythrobacter marensis]
MHELVAFEAAARHRSFTGAAVELNLTQGAISRAVAALEQRLRTPLFKRVRQRVSLTPVGRDYQDQVRALLGQLNTATRQAMSAGTVEQTLHIATLPTFGIHWLTPRLPQFLALHPHVTVNLASRTRPFSFEAEGFDLAIHHGEDAWPGGTLRRIVDETMVPMCSPEYREAKAIEAPSDLGRATLIHLRTRPAAWAEWHAAAGLRGDGAYRGPVYDQFGMAVSGAAAGLGVALLPELFAAEQIEDGKLVTLFDLELRTGSAYYIVLPEAGDKPAAVDFAEWLATQLPG